MNCLTDLLFPPRCALCRAYLPMGRPGMLCPPCAQTLPQYQLHEPFSVPGTDSAAAALWFQGDVRTAMHRFKFQHAKQYADWFAQQLAPVLAEHFPAWRPDCITYVPLGALRYRTRGYNQSALVARKLALAFSLPCMSLLSKRPFAGHQVGRTAAERWDAAMHAFRLRGAPDLSGRRVVLVDDVLTTGATVSACCTLLRQAHAERIFVLSVAKTPGSSAEA